MGCLLGLLSREQNESLRLFVGVGVLGGFTTFSAFSSDSLRMIQRGEFGPALGYLALSLGGSLLFCWLGYALFANQG
jgi:CrcB protein